MSEQFIAALRGVEVGRLRSTKISRGGENVLKFLLVHPLSAPLTLEEGVPLMKRIAGGMTTDAYWITSWLQTNAEGKVVKVFCHWDGTSAEAVKSAAQRLCPELPLEGVYPLTIVNSGDFR